MEPHTRTHLQWYFDRVADHHNEALLPAYNPLSRRLTDYLAPTKGQLIADLGSGTGYASLSIQQQGASPVACDLSHGMLRTPAKAALLCTQCDLHKMPFATNTFDGALAGFAFNSTAPAHTLRETLRILKPGAALAISEWGTEDEISATFSDIFADYCSDSPSPTLKRLRDHTDKPLPWEDLETLDDLRDLIAGCGFVDTTDTIITPSIRFSTVEQFMAFKLAWPLRRAEFAEMPVSVQKLCRSDLHENLSHVYANKNGHLEWRPNVILVKTHKPT